MRTIALTFSLACAFAAAPASAAGSKAVPVLPETWLTAEDVTCTFGDCPEGGSVVRYILYVLDDGRVSGCRVLESSGVRHQDRTTCRLLMRRAKFIPATDQNGEPKPGYYESTVRWTTPSPAAGTQQ